MGLGAVLRMGFFGGRGAFSLVLVGGMSDG